MNHFFRFAKRHWPALLAIAYMVWQTSRDDIRQNPVAWICVALGAVGIVMNLVVIIANGGMPAAVRDDEIPDESRPHYRPMDQTTRLAFLADWIPVGNLMISPGDILLMVAVALLVLRSIFSF